MKTSFPKKLYQIKTENTIVSGKNLKNYFTNQKKDSIIMA